MTRTLLIVAATFLAACSASGSESETVIHAWAQPDPAWTARPAPAPNPGLTKSENDLIRQIAEDDKPYYTVVEVSDGCYYKISDNQAWAYLKPGTPVKVYSGRSNDGRTYRSLKTDEPPGIRWVISPASAPNSEPTRAP